MWGICTIYMRHWLSHTLIAVLAYKRSLSSICVTMCYFFTKLCLSYNITKHIPSRSNQVTEPSASTSREAQKQTPNTAPTRKPKSPTKTFVKFKDDKYKYQPKRYITQASGRPLQIGYSPSQIVSRKILRTIKKKKKQSLNFSRTKIGTRNRSFSICDLTETTKNKSTPKPTNDDDDDDCVLIGSPQPEVILIDDETGAEASNLGNTNISNISQLSTNQDPVLRTYYPIGSASTFRDDYCRMLHSTPKLFSNKCTKYPITSRYKLTMPVLREKSPEMPPESENPLEHIQASNIIRERLRNRRKGENSNEDDSVIFVSEETAKEPPSLSDFISLSTPSEKYPISTSEEPKKKRKRNEGINDLFTSKEQKQLEQYNNNAYNPNKDTPSVVTKKRMVIVDGSNVAYQHALNKEFSVKGLKICIEYFEKLGHEVKAVVPQFRMQKLKSTDPATLEKLHEEGKIVFTPCKNLPGKSSSSYDDRFILQLASELDAAVVSNDNYRDLINENQAFKKIIENRVIGFSWCNDLFILPKDPYGKWGPALSTILNRL